MENIGERLQDSRPSAQTLKLTRVHLVRHGETDWNAEGRVQGQSESVLTEQGRMQAQRLAVALQPLTFARIFCSSSQRARQTAALIFANRAAEIVHRDELREIYLGPWEGLLYKQVAALYPSEHIAFREAPHLFSVPGAETFAQLQERSRVALKEISTSHTGQEVAVVSHGAWIRSVLADIEGKSLQQLWEPPAVSNCAHIIVDIDRSFKVRLVKQVTDSHWT